MKSIVQCIIISCLVLCSSPRVGFAEERAIQWEHKAFRGVSNVGLCLLEVFRTAYVMTEKYDPYVGWSKGAVCGSIRSVQRFGVGAVEVFTFPFAFPRENDEPLMEPEYVWQGWEDPSVE